MPIDSLFMPVRKSVTIPCVDINQEDLANETIGVIFGKYGLFEADADEEAVEKAVGDLVAWTYALVSDALANGDTVPGHNRVVKEATLWAFASRTEADKARHWVAKLYEAHDFDQESLEMLHAAFLVSTCGSIIRTGGVPFEPPAEARLN